MAYQSSNQIAVTFASGTRITIDVKLDATKSWRGETDRAKMLDKLVEDITLSLRSTPNEQPPSIRRFRFS